MNKIDINAKIWIDDTKVLTGAKIMKVVMVPTLVRVCRGPENIVLDRDALLRYTSREIVDILNGDKTL